jgi:hypothetical protein
VKHIVIAALLLADCATAPPRQKVIPTARERTPPSNVALADELNAMRAADQEVRQRWVEDQKNEAIRAELRQLSIRQTARLDEIVRTYGWPGITLVGFNGMDAAWTIAQHGGHDFLEKMLPLMYEAARSGELDERLYGTTLDRVLVRRGQKQLYGTQLDIDVATGKCQPYPIEDPEHVEERRKRAGLDPLEEDLKEMCAMYLQPQKQ